MHVVLTAWNHWLAKCLPVCTEQTKRHTPGGPQASDERRLLFSCQFLLGFKRISIRTSNGGSPFPDNNDNAPPLS